MASLLGTSSLSLIDFADLVLRPRKLGWDAAALTRVEASSRLLMQFLDEGRRIYGVNTGFGEEGRLVLRPEGVARLQSELVSYHGCGTGAELSEAESRSVLLARLWTLSRGYSGVRPALIEHLNDLFAVGLAPVIPELGSVGASGDLTPLSYLAALVMGQRRAWYRGEIRASSEVLGALKLRPLELQGREALALMNGTSFMTALAVLGWVRLRRWLDLAQTFTAWGTLALDLEEEFYLEVPNRLKGHPGVVQAAGFLLSKVQLQRAPVGSTDHVYNIQPRYSFRCAPQVYGMALEAFETAETWLKNELNGVDDNPLIDPETERLYHNGNFSGFHVSLACDLLRQSLASVVNLLDRQAQLLLDPSQNRGLGANLADWDPNRPQFGLKAVGIALSSLAAEVQELATSVLNRSLPTESGNQDVVSQGAVSARLLRRAEELAWHALAHAGLVAFGALRRSARQGALRDSGLFKKMARIDTSENTLEVRLRVILRLLKDDEEI